MVLGKLPVPGRPTIWIIVGQGPTVLAVRCGWALYGHFYCHLSLLSSFSLSLGDARYRLKYCLKGALNPKQPTNVRAIISTFMHGFKIIWHRCSPSGVEVPLEILVQVD